MPLDTWETVQVAIPSFAHPVRAGSQLALRVSAPGRNHGTWLFEPPPDTTLTIGTGPEHPSRLVLGELPELSVPPELPPCPALRGQPCRPIP